MGYALAAGDNARVSVPGPAGDFAAYSECVAVADPQSDAVVVASKRFSDVAQYKYFLATWTLIGGQWSPGQSPPMPAEGQHCGDPALMCDLEQVNGQTRTNVYLVGNPFFGTRDEHDYGVCVFKSTDLGDTWQYPPPQLPLSRRREDDKPACVSDTTGGPYNHNLYVTWDSDVPDGEGGWTTVVLFARSTDHATNWEGVAGRLAGSQLVGAGALSTPIVMPDGTLHVFSIYGNSIVVNTSVDGGDSFTDARAVAKGLSLVDAGADAPGLPFRVGSLVAATPVGDRAIVLAWTDNREGSLRIYCRTSEDNGQTWSGSTAGVDGEPLHGNAESPEPPPPEPITFFRHHEFHPQLTSAGGVAVCSYYRYHQKPRLGGYGWIGLIDVLTTVSVETGDGFPFETVTTDQPWDPTRGLVHLTNNQGELVGFVGDYFGLCAANTGLFYPVWTDTRDGKQQLYTALVRFTSKPDPPAKPLTCGGLKAWLAEWLASGGSTGDQEYQDNHDLYVSQCPPHTLPSKVILPS